MKTTIALCMIVRDEVDRIGTAVRSAMLAVDELIIVDTGSVDGTVARCREFGAYGKPFQLLGFEWNDNFADARNFALKHVESSMVLVLDADEELTREGLQTLLEMKKNYIPKCMYNLNIVNELDVGSASHLGTRLFPNQKDVYYDGSIHEVPKCANTIEIVDLPGTFIVHHGYKSAVVTAKSKNDRNTAALARAIINDPGNPQLRVYMAESLFAMDCLWEAVDQLRVALRLCLHYNGADVIYDQAAAHLLNMLYGLGQKDLAIREANLAIRQGTIAHPAFWYCLGAIQLEVDNASMAVSSFYKSISLAKSRTLQIDPAVISWKPYVGLIKAFTALKMEEFIPALIAAAVNRGAPPEEVTAACTDPHATPSPSVSGLLQ